MIRQKKMKDNIADNLDEFFAPSIFAPFGNF